MNLTILFIIITAIVVVFLILIIIKNRASPRKLYTVPDLLKQGRVQQALKIVKAALADNSKDPRAHWYMGKIYIADNKAELALMEYKAVGSLALFNGDVNEVEYRQTIAKLYEKFDQLEEALKEYILLAQKDQKNPEYFYQCARLFDLRGKYDVAGKYARKAIALSPRMAKGIRLLGMLLYKTKHPTEAKQQLELSLKYDPSSYDSYFFLGKLLKDSNDTNGALIAFDKAQKSTEYRTKAIIERGGLFMKQNVIDNAIIEFERAIKSSKDESSNDVLYARYFLASCYEQIKNLDKAIDQWEKIYQKKSTFKDVAEKISQYQEYRTDDRMKDFLTCNQPEFVEICKNISTKALHLVIQDTKITRNGVDFIAIEGDSEKWLGTKKMPNLVRFIRVADTLTDSAVRDLIDDMKSLSVIRGILITSASFTHTVLEFAENRPIELYQKEQLQVLLKQSS